MTIEWHFATSIADVEENAATPVQIGGQQIAVFKIGGQLYAINNVCTHQFALLSDGYVEGDTVECPLHQARFHIPSGKALSPPAETDVQTFPVTVTDGQIFIAIDRE